MGKHLRRFFEDCAAGRRAHLDGASQEGKGVKDSHQGGTFNTIIVYPSKTHQRRISALSGERFNRSNADEKVGPMSRKEFFPQALLWLMLCTFLLLLGGVAQAANEKKWDFSKYPQGRMPSEFETAYYGPYLKYGVPRGVWSILSDKGHNVLCASMISNKELEVGGTAHLLALVKGFECLDGDFSANLKLVSGRYGTGVGIVWRYHDPMNYMVLRHNAQEKEISLYRTIDGCVTDLFFLKLPSLETNKWDTLGVKVRGERIEIFLDGRKIGSVLDHSIDKKGRVGLWLRGRITAYFKDFTIEDAGGNAADLAGKLPPDVTSWDITTVDAAKGSGHYCSLQFNRKDEPGIAYYDINLKNARYAALADKSWHVETIDGRVDTGYFTGLAYNRINEPNIVYCIDSLGPSRDSPYSGPHFAYKRRNKWNIVFGFDRGGIANGVMALDRDDYPHIAYMDKTSRRLKYSHWNGANWTTEMMTPIERVPAVVPSGVSIAVDSKNSPVIAYQDLSISALQYATRKSAGSWSVETVDKQADPIIPGAYCSVALDRKDNPHIAYYVRGQKVLKYATRKKNGKWETTVVDNDEDVGAYSSLALDKNGKPHIAYCDFTRGIIRYCYQDGKRWKIVKTNCQGYYPSLSLDKQGKPHIAFYDKEMDCLRIACPK
jgi:hypothetical protein